VKPEGSGLVIEPPSPRLPGGPTSTHAAARQPSTRCPRLGPGREDRRHTDRVGGEPHRVHGRGIQAGAHQLRHRRDWRRGRRGHAACAA
jgi:hypothetical protein